MPSLKIANIRLFCQQIYNQQFINIVELVEWMGAIQAQDFLMAKWGIGLRTKNTTEQIIEEVYNKGEIIRTHIMRPTWHIVSAYDLTWMMNLTSQRILNSAKGRLTELELTDEVLIKCTKIIEKSLLIETNLTRSDIAEKLNIHKIITNENRLSHILFYLELKSVICSGPIVNNKLTYALFQQRVQYIKNLTYDEALAKLAGRFFKSHGPATINDFIWWSGLTSREAKIAIELIKSNFIAETLGSEKYWFSEPLRINLKNTVSLLPAYDEFLISYKNRSASISEHLVKHAISSNGIFRPIIIINGQVAGAWKRSIKKNNVEIKLKFFTSINKSNKELIKIEIEKFEHFIGKPVKMIE
jgi:hypothetical protein